jgi:hypothetical protein
MGIIKLGLTVVFLFSCLFTNVTERPALAHPDDLGEVCIEILGGAAPLRLHVISYEAGTFQVIGKMPRGQEHFMPVHGAAVLERNNVLIMTLSGSDGTAYSQTYTFMVGLSDPNKIGVYRSIDNSEIIIENPYPGAPEFVTHTDWGQFRFIQCP